MKLFIWNGVEGPLGRRLVAYLRDEEVGSLTFFVNHVDRSAYVAGVDVEEAHRGRRIATALYRRMKAHLKAAGVTVLRGEVQAATPVRIRERVFGPGKTDYKWTCGKLSLEDAVRRIEAGGYVLARTSLKRKPNEHSHKTNRCRSL